MDANTSPRHDGSDPGQPAPAAQILADISAKGLVPWLLEQGETPASLRSWYRDLQALIAGDAR
jgi:hypothetical protein